MGTLAFVNILFSLYYWSRVIVYRSNRSLLVPYPSFPLHRQYGQYDYSQPMGYASPGMMPQPQQPYTGQIFQPTPAYTPANTQSMYSSSFEDEPPLLEGESGARAQHCRAMSL